MWIQTIILIGGVVNNTLQKTQDQVYEITPWNPLARCSLAKLSLIKPNLAKPSLAKPSLAKPSLVEFSLAKSSFTQLTEYDWWD